MKCAALSHELLQVAIVAVLVYLRKPRKTPTAQPQQLMAFNGSGAMTDDQQEYAPLNKASVAV